MSLKDSTIKLVKLACGKHWGLPKTEFPLTGKSTGDPCSKCAYFAKQRAEDDRKGLLMHNGTPWIALLGDPVPKPNFWES